MNMLNIRVFGLAAVVLFVLALIAADATNGMCFGVGYFIWVAAGLLAFALDHLQASVMSVMAGRNKATRSF